MLYVTVKSKNAKNKEEYCIENKMQEREIRELY